MGQQIIQIRTAAPADGAELLQIYAPYVTGTAITFEYDVPTVAEFTHRISQTLETYPYLVAERDGEIVGYAYAGPFHARPAYDWSVETSIYIARQYRREGIGHILHDAFEEALKNMGILNLYACIAYPIGDDPYLTKDSIYFHERLGYTWIGEFHQCGYKFNRWYNMVWMEKFIGEHTIPQKPIKKPIKKADKRRTTI